MGRIIIPEDRYPLAWPEGTPRAITRRPAAFAPLSAAQGLREVQDELNRLGARTMVITTNYASGSVGPDPGAAAYWTIMERGVLVPHVIACDRWQQLGHNLHAIALSINALRGIDRWGAVRREQAFAGFRELPAGAGAAPGSTPVARPWREVLGGGFPIGISEADLFAIAKSRHRRLIAEQHPDRGGDPAMAAALNQAMDEATAELVRVRP